MNVSLGGPPIQAISIQVSPEIEVQLVAGEAEWYEYNKVPCSSLLAGQKECLTRDETVQKLKDFFLENPQARNVARIAKALFIPLVEDLPKRPWSLILTHMVYRECIRKQNERIRRTLVERVYWEICWQTSLLMGFASPNLPWQWLQSGQKTPKVVTMPSMWKRRWYVGETLFLRS